MIADGKVPHGTADWFEMVGTLMVEAASRAGLSPDLTVSLVERYTDGVELLDGLVQGLRFDIVCGEPSFRVGVGRHERADITIRITAAAARVINTLHGADPNYRIVCDAFTSTGEMGVDGDLSKLGAWMTTVHDPIVDRTR